MKLRSLVWLFVSAGWLIPLGTGIGQEVRDPGPPSGQETVVRGGLDPAMVRKITGDWKAVGWSCKFAAPTVTLNLQTGEISPRSFKVIAVLQSPEGIIESYTITQTILAQPGGALVGRAPQPIRSGKRKWILDASLYSGSKTSRTTGDGDWRVVKDGENGKDGWLLKMGNGVGGVFKDIPFRLHGGDARTPVLEAPEIPVDSVLAEYFPAEVIAVNGEAWVYRGGQQVRVVKGMSIGKGDLLETGRDGRFMVLFGENKSHLVISPNTKIKVECTVVRFQRGEEEVANTFSIFCLFKGAVKYTTSRLLLLPGQSFRTDPGMTGSIRGTDLVVSTDPTTGRDDLYVLDGVVECSSPHENRSVGAGQHLWLTKGGRVDVQLTDQERLEATGALWSPPAEVLATLPKLAIKRVWVEHNTHLTAPAWWEKGTEWEGKAAMTIYAQLQTWNLQGRKVSVEIAFENADGSLVKWQRGAPPHCTGDDGVLRPWWGDQPPKKYFEYRAFRIPVPYAAINQSTVQGAGGELRVKVKASSGAAYARGEISMPVSQALSD